MLSELLEAGRHGRPVTVLSEWASAKLAEADVEIAGLHTIRAALADVAVREAPGPAPPNAQMR